MKYRLNHHRLLRKKQHRNAQGLFYFETSYLVKAIITREGAFYTNPSIRIVEFGRMGKVIVVSLLCWDCWSSG